MWRCNKNTRRLNFSLVLQKPTWLTSSGQNAESSFVLVSYRESAETTVGSLQTEAPTKSSLAWRTLSPASWRRDEPDKLSLSGNNMVFTAAPPTGQTLRFCTTSSVFFYSSSRFCLLVVVRTNPKTLQCIVGNVWEHQPHLFPESLEFLEVIT